MGMDFLLVQKFQTVLFRMKHTLVNDMTKLNIPQIEYCQKADIFSGDNRYLHIGISRNDP